MQKGTCKLCLRETDLCDSHYMPRAMYKYNRATALTTPHQFDIGLVVECPQPGEGQMTNSEQKVLWRGVAAGMVVGLATGLMIALFIVIATKPELAALVR